MRKGKAPVMEEKVVWTTGSDGKFNYCIGFFNDNADRPFIIKEANNAPIDYESLKSKVSLAKQRKELVTDPINSGYSEQYVLLLTTKELDEDDIKKIKLPYVNGKDATVTPSALNLKLSERDAKALELSKGIRSYKFQTFYDEDQMNG